MEGKTYADDAMVRPVQIEPDKADGVNPYVVDVSNAEIRHLLQARARLTDFVNEKDDVIRSLRRQMTDLQAELKEYKDFFIIPDDSESMYVPDTIDSFDLV